MAAIGRVAAGFIVYRVIRREIQYLMLQTSYEKNHWTPPKGHVDPGETDFQTAVRETHEEAGLTSSDLRIAPNFKKSLTYSVRGAPKIVHYWLAEAIDPDVTVSLSDEHMTFEWAGLARAKELSPYEDMRALLDEAETFIRQ